MSKAKIAITIDVPTLERIDRLVEAHVFPNRSRAIEGVVGDALERLERGRLARECAKLDPVSERTFAEEGLAEDLDEWPEY